jgi:hypothetical protein
MKPKPKGVPPLVAFLVMVSMLFIGILIYVYIEAKRANPQMIRVAQTSGAAFPAYQTARIPVTRASRPAHSPVSRRLGRRFGLNNRGLPGAAPYVSASSARFPACSAPQRGEPGPRSTNSCSTPV